MSYCSVIALAIFAVAILVSIWYFLKQISFKRELHKRFKEEAELLDKEVNDLVERVESRKKDVWTSWVDKSTVV